MFCFSLLKILFLEMFLSWTFLLSFLDFFVLFFCFLFLSFSVSYFLLPQSLSFSRELLSFVTSFFLPQELFFCRKIFPFCRDLFLFCHEHFYFAGSFFLLPSWHLWAAVITWRRKLVIFLKDLKIFWININWGDMI